VREFVNTNNLGTSRMVTSVWAIASRRGGRFIIVASAFGSLRRLCTPATAALSTQRRSTWWTWTRVMLEYVDLVEAGRAVDAVLAGIDEHHVEDRSSRYGADIRTAIAPGVSLWRLVLDWWTRGHLGHGLPTCRRRKPSGGRG